MVLRIVLIILAGCCVVNAGDDSIEISRLSFGAICRSNSVIGSAFVLGEPPRLVTCAHVIQGHPSQGYRYTFASNAGSNYAATVIRLLPRYDIAVLDVASPTPLPSLNLGDMRRVRPGDKVLYIGFDTTKNAMNVAAASVSSTGVTLSDGGTADFLEFKGKARPGYSGGPVMNPNGEVVGMIRDSWGKPGAGEGSPDVLLNRAWSVEPAMFMNETLFVVPGER